MDVLIYVQPVVDMYNHLVLCDVTASILIISVVRTVSLYAYSIYCYFILPLTCLKVIFYCMCYWLLCFHLHNFMLLLLFHDFMLQPVFLSICCNLLSQLKFIVFFIFYYMFVCYSFSNLLSFHDLFISSVPIILF